MQEVFKYLLDISVLGLVNALICHILKVLFTYGEGYDLGKKLAQDDKRNKNFSHREITGNSEITTAQKRDSNWREGYKDGYNKTIVPI